MTLYALAMLFGFVLCAAIVHSRNKATLDKKITGHLLAGSRVIVCVDDDATVMQVVEGKLRVTKAVTDFVVTDVEEADGASLVD